MILNLCSIEQNSEHAIPLARNTGRVSGPIPGNQHDGQDDQVSAPPGILAERLATRTTNRYGKDPAELAETLQYQQTVEPLLKASATLEVVTTVPVARVADIVLDYVVRPAGPAAIG
jgi:hypothetical protein